MRALIVSASMGGGHDGAAQELRRRLDQRGHRVRVEDFLSAFPLGTGALVRTGYKWQLRVAPWSYEASYRTWYAHPRLAGPLAAGLSGVAGRVMRRWIAESRPDVVVSTYPMSSLVLGRLREARAIDVPVATFITDFAVHPLWTHPGVDEHLCVHPQAAADARRHVGGVTTSPGPLVPERFTASLVGGARARAELGLAHDDRVVLLVAGSWGVGEIEQTFDDIVAIGRYTPLVVCGRNEKLRRHLAARAGGAVIGWTEEMPTLMAAADVLVQNAGGLTCMEAFAAGLPVVSYRPIAGHGRGNAADMERAGVAAWVPSAAMLGPILDEVTGPRRRELIDAGRAMFTGDAAEDVERLAASGRSRPTISRRRDRGRST
ncbi:MAG TPA: glycosyltransferase [Acidimicrobiales bacterium]|nr:glycosyltransferase [Acidimicrobiales bacterium]